ncbi:MAG: TonB-dependent receptor [Cyclobacteriaceae bacterium]
MKHILLVLLMVSTLGLFGQDKFTLSGYIKDGANGEDLIGATVFVQELSAGGVTNVYGFYSITLEPGTYTVEFRYIGFDTQVKTITLDQNVRQDIELGFEDTELEAVIVSAEGLDANVSSVEMSTAKLDVNSITKMPAFAGEVDIIKSIQLLPGVSTVGEGASGFNVRGGGVGQNLILLDEAPVYQSSHLFGFFSVFNPDAVKDVKLYKGGVPANYGGRLSSILDIRMKEGNKKEYEVSGGVGTVFSRLAVEGPIVKDKASFIVAGRRSYIDILARPFTDLFDEGAGLFFYDLTAKTNVDLNDKNRLYLSGYFGRDVFKFDERQGFDWGNQTGTFRWNHLFNDKFFSNFTTYYSNYDYGFAFGENDLDKFEWDSHIQTINFKPEFTYFLSPKSELTFGGETLLYTFEPAVASGVSDGVETNISLEEKKSLEASVYIANDHKITDNITAQYGLRLSTFTYLGPGTSYELGDTIPGMRRPVIGSQEHDDWDAIATYQNLEPRASVRFQLNEQSSIKASYNKMNQYIHLISNTVASTPIDIWQPSTNNIKPQGGSQVGIGYFRNFLDNQFETSIETYYKWNVNQVDYIDGASIFINPLLEAELLSGKGRAYGMELYLRKTKGKLNGWVSYTLGKTEVLIDGINFQDDFKERKGNWYPTKYDQRHNLKLTSNYQINERLNLSAVFTYISGTPATFPTDRYTVQGMVIPLTDNQRHNFRIPDYHRLDLSFTIDNLFLGRKKMGASDFLVVSLYNAYARKNPFSIYFSQGQDRVPTGSPAPTQAAQVSILGTIVPAVAYNFKF